MGVGINLDKQFISLAAQLGELIFAEPYLRDDALSARNAGENNHKVWGWHILIPVHLGMLCGVSGNCLQASHFVVISAAIL